MFEGTLGLFNTIGAVLSVLLLIGIVVSKLGSAKISDEKKALRAAHFNTGDKDPISQQNPHIERWLKIENLFHSQSENDWRAAILDADSMLEACITDFGFVGDSFGEKLKSMDRSRVPALDAMWEVHKLRNTIAHEGSHFSLTHRQAYRAYKIYENILRDFQYI